MFIRKPHAHQLVHIDLTDSTLQHPVRDDHQLLPRLGGAPIQYCYDKWRKDKYCVDFSDSQYIIASSIASTILQTSDLYDCVPKTGMINGIQWRYRSTKNCHMTASLDTVTGGLMNYLDSAESKFCNVQCVRLDHGDTNKWVGYLCIGPVTDLKDVDVDNTYCGPAGYDFDQCHHGGEKDDPFHGS